jgi:hypothetical protein
MTREQKTELSRIASILGSRTSKKKAAASRRNGLLGGPATWRKNREDSEWSERLAKKS